MTRDAERQLALTDHLYLGTEVMGMDFQTIPHRGLFDEFLQKDIEPDPKKRMPLCDLATGVKKRMILWPRGTFKTSAIIVEMVQLILNYPNIRMCFLTGSDDLAKRQIKRVRQVFEQPSERFLYLFPEVCAKKIGNLHHFTVPTRTNHNFPEPTMAISTAKSVKAGSHFDIIFVDDLVNETNYRSPKSLEKCIQDYRDICPLLDPGGYMYVTGTRYSFGDLYQEIQDMAKKEMDQLGTRSWSFSILSCWVKYCVNCEPFCSKRDLDHKWGLNASEPECHKCKCKGWSDSGVKDVLFPQFRAKDGRRLGHTVAFLESEKVQLGSEFFANQYENNPIAAGEQTFTPELIAKQTLHHESQWPTALQAPTFFVGDLSYIGDDSRDKSVIYVCRYWQGQTFVIDCLSGKWDSWQLAENLFIGVLKYRPTMIYLERFLGWEAYDTVLKIFARDHKIENFPVDWTPMSYAPKAKVVRIGACKTPLEARRLWIYSCIPFYETLCDGLKKWPRLGKHRDYQDCLGLVCQAPYLNGIDSLPTVTTESNKNWLRKLNPPQLEDARYDTRVPGSY